MTSPRSLALLLVVPALAVSACGGKSDSDKIKDIIKKVASDNTYACSHVTKNLLSQLGGSEKACVAGLKGSPKGAVEGDIKVSVNGNGATADFRAKNGNRHVTFVKQNGSWLIDKIAG